MSITIGITRKSASPVTLQINNHGVVDMGAQTWYTSPGDPGRVIESFELMFFGTDAAIRVAVELLGAMRTEVDEFLNDPAYTGESIWFSIADSVAASTRRSLIYSIEFMPLQRGTTSQALGAQGILWTTVTVERAEAWENAILTSPVAVSPNLFGGVLALNPAIAPSGNLGGRIDEFKINVGTFYSGITNYINKLWLGCQPYYGTITYGSVAAYLDTTFEIDTDTFYTLGSIATASVTTYSGGTCLVLGSVPSTKSELLEVSLNQYGGADVYRGKWLVLARTKVQNTSVVGLQLDWGRRHTSLKSINTYQSNEMVYVSGTNFDLVELGMATWPSTNFTDNETYNSLNDEWIRINVQQISGTTTSFYLDNLVFIPAAHYIKANGLDVAGGIELKIYTDAAGRTSAINSNINPAVQYTDWNYPKEGGYFVVAAAANGSHQLSAAGTCTMTMWYTARYKNFIP